MQKWLLFLFLVSVFIYSFLPVKDTDFGWHYRCGNEFLTKGILCTKNTFSYYLPNYTSNNPSFLYDIVLAFVFNHFGFLGVSLLGASIMTVVASVFLELSKADLIIKIIAFYALIILSDLVFNLGLRSQTTTFLFFLFFIWLLQLSHQRKFKLLFLIPFLMFIWVNVHVGSFVGLIVLACFHMDLLYRLITKNDRKVFTLTLILPLVILISFVATLINPFGIHVYKALFDHATSPLGTMIAEWVAPPWWHLTVMVIGTIFVTFLMLKNKKFSLFYWLLLAFSLIISFQARRNLPFFYVLFFLVILDNIPQRLNDISLPDEFIGTIGFTLVVFLAIVRIPPTWQFDTSSLAYCEGYPCDIMTKYPKLEGNIFTHYEWGGYLIWQYPKLKPFVDGRVPAWKNNQGKSPYEIYLSIMQAQPGWNEILDKYKTNYILVNNGTFLDAVIKQNSTNFNWKEIYRNETRVLYQHVGS